MKKLERESEEVKMNNLRDRMQKCIESTKRELGTYRTGRANPELLSRVYVDYYGNSVPLKQVASINVPEPMTLQLKVFDQTAVKSIEKAIQTSDLNLNPMVEANTITLRLPQLTEERRKDLVKQIKKQGEESKISLRNIRRDFLEEIKAKEKSKELSVDEVKRQHDEAQKLTDQFSKQIDDLTKAKETEIMTI